MDTHNLDESPRHRAEGKKLVSEGYILYDFTYMTFSKDEVTVIEKRTVVARGWRHGETVTTKGQHERILWG